MKKLLIITGAGGSLEFGMPSVSQVDNLFTQQAIKLFPLVEPSGESLYSWIKARLNTYCSQNPRYSAASVLNFENILYAMQLLAEQEKDIEFNLYKNRLNAFNDLATLPMIKDRPGNERLALGKDLSNLQSSLIDHLLNEMRKRCQTLGDDRKTELSHLSHFLSALKETFELGFINLNYDNVILSALPDLKTGFNQTTGEFERHQVYDKSWNFCYHLHGSVHFDMRGGHKTDMHDIWWNNDLDSKFQPNSGGRSGNMSGEGIMHVNSNIIGGLDKANQLLREPFVQFFSQVDHLIYEADAILFMGYGFADFHLNKLFPFIRQDKLKTRKVVVLDYAYDTQDTMEHRQDEWAINLGRTIPFNAHQMHQLSPGIVKQYKDEHAFEKSGNPDLPLAIWYNGLLAACRFPEHFLRELL